MKKLITFALIGITTCSLVACQTIPITTISEEPTATITSEVSENEAHRFEQPKTQTVLDAQIIPLANYKTEQNWVDSFKNQTNDLTIKIDAQIFVPDTQKHTVYSTEWQPISVETAKTAADVLFDGTIYDDNYQMSKEEAQILLDEVLAKDAFEYGFGDELRYIQEHGEPSVPLDSPEFENWEYADYMGYFYEFANDMVENGGMTFEEALADQIEAYTPENGFNPGPIAWLQEIVNSDAEEPAPFTQTKYEFTLSHNSNIMSLTDETQKEYFLAAYSNDTSPNAHISYKKDRNKQYWLGNVLSAEEMLDIGITKEDAANTAARTIEEMGIENFVMSDVICSYYYATEESFEEYYSARRELFQNGGTEVDLQYLPLPKTDDFAYTFYFTPQIEGVPVEYVHNSLGATVVSIDGAPHLEFWDAELITVMVTEEGVVDFNWQNIGPTPAVKEDDVQILSTEEIQEIAKGILPLKLTDHDSYFVEDFLGDVVIDKITLSLMRVVDDSALLQAEYVDPTTDQEPIKLNGADYEQMYIPVWDFMGHYEKLDKEMSFLTLNAIDGTAIDRNLGF